MTTTRLLSSGCRSELPLLNAEHDFSEHEPTNSRISQPGVIVTLALGYCTFGCVQSHRKQRRYHRQTFTGAVFLRRL